MSPLETIRAEVQRLRRAVPFRPFALRLANGERVIIGHPENIAFDPAVNGSGGSKDFFVYSNELRLSSTFAAVIGVTMLERGDTVS